MRGCLLYSRSLYLPPPALPARTYPHGHPIVDGLRPFRLKLYRQRATVTIARTLSLAVLVAVVLLLLRMRGVALPLPQLPLAVAGIVFLAGLCAAALQRPSAAQMAHALDQRLGLRELLGSALEIAPTDGPMAALLRQRAGKMLRDANSDFVLPQPSLKREQVCLVCLLLFAAPCALLAANAPLPRSVAAAVDRRHVGAGRAAPGALLKARAGIMSIRVRALGASLHSQAISGAQVHHGANVTHLTGGRGGAAGDTLGGKGLGLHVAPGQARGGLAGNTGNPIGAATGRAALRSGRGAILHLTTGKNSSAGGMLSQEQQALKNLRNSVSSAGSQQAGSSSAAGAGQGQNNPQSGQNGSRTGQPPRNRGRYRGRGRAGARGATSIGAGSGLRRGARSGALLRQGPMSGDGDPLGRLGRGGDSTGTGNGRQSAGNTNGGVTGSGARLGNNGSVVLNGAPGQGGRMVLTVGLPNQGLTFAGASVYGAVSTPLLTVPGYVAPDSNAIAPDERSAVQGYFSPPPPGSQ